MNTLFDDMYMKKHLAEYILFQLEQGYALNDIKKALSRFGYKKNTIHDILRQLDLSIFPKKKKVLYSRHDLDEELKIYVQSMLVDYIVKEHKVGYALEAIRNALINFGHDPAVVDEAILLIEKGKVVDYRKEAAVMKFPQQIVGSLTLFFLFAFLVFLSIATDSSILTILPNFLPAFIVFLVMNAAFYFSPATKLLAALPLFAVIIVVAAFIGGIQYGILGKAPGSETILILNAAMAFVSTSIICAFSKKGKEEVVVQIKDKKQRNIHEEEEKLIEKQIHEPKFGAPVPEEPLHLKGHPNIPHAAPAARQSISGFSHAPSQGNTMLHYLKEGIDKKQSAQQTMPHAVARKPLHSLERLPEQRKKREAKIPLKKFE